MIGWEIHKRITSRTLGKRLHQRERERFVVTHHSPPWTNLDVNLSDTKSTGRNFIRTWASIAPGASGTFCSVRDGGSEWRTLSIMFTLMSLAFHLQQTEIWLMARCWFWKEMLSVSLYEIWHWRVQCARTRRTAISTFCVCVFEGHSELEKSTCSAKSVSRLCVVSRGGGGNGFTFESWFSLLAIHKCFSFFRKVIFFCF